MCVVHIKLSLRTTEKLEFVLLYRSATVTLPYQEQLACPTLATTNLLRGSPIHPVVFGGQDAEMLLYLLE